MCNLHGRQHELLIHGEEGVVFAHASGCSDCQTTLLAERAYPIGCRLPLLGYRLQLHLDAILRGEGAPPELRVHLEDCPACRIELSDGRDALAELEPPTPRMQWTCAHCGEWVARGAIAACATCSTPHHAPCFDHHGHCALGGCLDRRYVQGAPERRTGLPRWLLGGLIGLVVSAGLDSGNSGTQSAVSTTRLRALPAKSMARA